MRLLYEIAIEVDSDALEARTGSKSPPSDDPDDWDFSDLIRAVEPGIVDPAESVLRKI